jgi:hypothetical protein
MLTLVIFRKSIVTHATSLIPSVNIQCKLYIMIQHCQGGNMFAEVSSALSSVKAMTDIVKGMASLKLEAEINAKTAELTGVIIEVQQRLLKTGEEMETLYKQIRQLETQLAQNNSLAAYERVRLPRTNVLVYGLKAAVAVVAGRTHDHYACPVCIEKEKVLMTLQEEAGDNYLRCHGCRNTFSHTPEPEINYPDSSYY